jgi:hypothetical protein
MGMNDFKKQFIYNNLHKRPCISLTIKLSWKGMDRHYLIGYKAQLESDGFLTIYDSVYMPASPEGFQWLQGVTRARQLTRKPSAAELRLKLALRQAKLYHSYSACQVVGVYPCY